MIKALEIYLRFLNWMNSCLFLIMRKQTVILCMKDSYNIFNLMRVEHANSIQVK